MDRETQAEIAERVEAWEFGHDGEESRELHRVVKETAVFLRENRHLFPQGCLPGYPVQLSAVVLRVYRIFAERSRGDAGNAQIVQAIVKALSGPSG